MLIPVSCWYSVRRPIILPSRILVRRTFFLGFTILLLRTTILLLHIKLHLVVINHFIFLVYHFPNKRVKYKPEPER